MVDNKYFFDEQVRMGFTTTHWPALVSLHRTAADWLKHGLGVETCFEFGSGLGFFLVGSQWVGLDTIGYDINPYERDFALSRGVEPERYILKDGEFKMPGKFDACYCIEVFEHIPDDELNTIIPQLAENCGYLYFTSTPYPTTPEQDEAWGHINIKQKNEWKALFAKHGFKFKHDAQQVTEWGMLFTSEKFDKW
jgi:SAM-dependent methyltransferase